MPFSLHAAFVPSCRQILAATLALIDKAEAFCTERKVDPQVLLGTRLIADMLPLTFQLRNVAGHSGGAIAAVRKGVFSPDVSPPERGLDAYRTLLTDADAILAAVTPEEMDGFIGQDMLFTFGELRMEYAAEDYLLSFAQPNFYFHATTAFDILRTQGVQIGKRDFIGKPRTKA